MKRATKGLTPRETEISTLIAWGLSQKEVAAMLGRSISTISNTLRKLYAKLGISKESELAAFVFCTKYGVDPKNDPLGNVRRAIGSITLLALLIFQLTINPTDTTIRRPRTPRTRRAETEYIIEQ